MNNASYFRYMESVRIDWFKDIHELIVKLDRTPRQVLIQGLIVEVTLKNTDEMGMELGLQDSILFRRSAIPAPVTISQTNTTGQLQTTSTTSRHAEWFPLDVDGVIDGVAALYADGAICAIAVRHDHAHFAITLSVLKKVIDGAIAGRNG